MIEAAMNAAPTILLLIALAAAWALLIFVTLGAFLVVLP